MSKATQLAKRCLEEGKIDSKVSAVGHAQFILTGKRTLTKEEAIKLFGDAADLLDVQFNRMEQNIRAIVAAEVQVADEGRRLISVSKDIAGKIGDAMARIDKVVVKDFEVKLVQLERFVAAMQALELLQRSGVLAGFAAAMGKGRENA